MNKNLHIPESFQVDINDFYNAVVKSTENYIYIVDMKQNISLISDNMYEDFDLPGRIVEDLISVWGKLVHEKDQKRYQDSISDMLSCRTNEHNLEYQVINRKKEYIWVVCRGLLTRDEDQNPIMFAGVVTPIGGRGKVDRTTGLLTQEECKNTIDLFQNQGYEKGGFLLLGLDNFSRLNNLKNHIFGDTVLRNIAQMIVSTVPHESSVYRFDGDEIAIFYPQATISDMKNIYQKIQFYTNHEHEIDGSSYFCTVSGGIAMLGEDAYDYLELIKCTMSALDASKKGGKNRCTVYSPELLKSNLYTMEIINQLQRSVLAGMKDFSLVYQPFVSSNGLELKGVEVLLRWTSETHGKIGPAEFIPLLESDNSIIPVGKWIMEQAFITCKEWLNFYPEFVMNINVSYLQIIDKDFIMFVKQLLSKYNLSPRHIVLELTESYFVTEMLILKDAFKSLRDIGIRFAMDDFGTGYSSLGLLSQSPADIIKIDRLFISFINDKDHSFNRSFIEAVIKLCHSVGISVCVEGVEYIDELNTVCDMNVDSIQGYYISKPMTKEEFEKKYCQKN